MTQSLTHKAMISRTDEIREKYPHYWRDEQAQAELAAIWGEAINTNGVIVDSSEEVLYDRDGCKASISIGTGSGLHAFSCHYSTPTEGHGSAPSVWGDLFGSYGEARTAAIEHLLKRLPSPDEERPQAYLDRMRQAVADLLRQLSLF